MIDPYEVFTTGRGGQGPSTAMLVLTNKLAEGTDEKPLADARFSRFGLSIIEKSKAEGTVKVTTANIPARSVSLIADRYRAALNTRNILLYVQPQSGTADVSVPYKERFLGGSWKGKTIPEAIGQPPSSEGVKNLQIQQSYLESNLAKYPGNAKMIAEIKRALQEISAGTFNSAAAEKGSALIPIYVAEKNFLKSRADSDNRVFCYSLTIQLDTAKNIGWEITVLNGYCPLAMDEKVRHELPQWKAMVNKTVNTFRLDDSEMAEFVSVMENNYEDFRLVHYREALQKAEEIRRNNMKNNKKGE